MLLIPSSCYPPTRPPKSEVVEPCLKCKIIERITPTLTPPNNPHFHLPCIHMTEWVSKSMSEFRVSRWVSKWVIAQILSDRIKALEVIGCLSHSKGREHRQGLYKTNTATAMKRTRQINWTVFGILVEKSAKSASAGRCLKCAIEHAGSFLPFVSRIQILFSNLRTHMSWIVFSLVSGDDVTVTNTKALENSPLPGDSISVRAQNVLSPRLMTFSFS